MSWLEAFRDVLMWSVIPAAVAFGLFILPELVRRWRR